MILLTLPYLNSIWVKMVGGFSPARVGGQARCSCRSRAVYFGCSQGCCARRCPREAPWGPPGFLSTTLTGAPAGRPPPSPLGPEVSEAEVRPGSSPWRPWALLGTLAAGHQGPSALNSFIEPYILCFRNLSAQDNVKMKKVIVFINTNVRKMFWILKFSTCVVILCPGNIMRIYCNIFT